MRIRRRGIKVPSPTIGFWRRRIGRRRTGAQNGTQAQTQCAEQGKCRAHAQQTDPRIGPGSETDAPDQKARQGGDPPRQAFGKKVHRRSAEEIISSSFPVNVTQYTTQAGPLQEILMVCRLRRNGKAGHIHLPVGKRGQAAAVGPDPLQVMPSAGAGGMKIDGAAIG